MRENRTPGSVQGSPGSRCSYCDGRAIMSNLRSHRGSYHSANRRHERQYFYKYMSAATAKIVMTTRKLRWSSPIIFNDPFDVTQELRLNFDADELNAAVTEQFAVLLEKGAQGRNVSTSYGQ